MVERWLNNGRTMVERAKQVLPAGGKKSEKNLKRLPIAAQCITTIPPFF
jgi:hypothetical protein